LLFRLLAYRLQADRLGGSGSPENAGQNAATLVQRATQARLSLPAKIRFPETETSSFGDWFESAVY
jgi:hypothetical protein